MTPEEIKELALSFLNEEIKEKLPREYFTILDEVCESISNGKVRIDDKTPTSKEEYLFCIYHAFKTNITLWNGLIQGIENQLSKGDTLNINYRGETFNYTF